MTIFKVKLNINWNSLVIIFLLFISFSSSAQNNKRSVPVLDPKLILKDFNSYYQYEYYNINLTEDYNAVDARSQPITKEVFLTRLTTGKFIPLKTVNSDGKVLYRLYTYTSPVNSEISSRVAQLGQEYYTFFKMEGKVLPKFYFVDINGRLFSSANTKGKIVLIKCWFLKCHACIQEMPSLNTLVDQYKNRNDILFISLALDSKEKLLKFQKQKNFKYVMVPDMKDYIEKKLKIRSYPTHLIINKEGKIAKVVSRAEDLVAVIRHIN